MLKPLIVERIVESQAKQRFLLCLKQRADFKKFKSSNYNIKQTTPHQEHEHILSTKAWNKGSKTSRRCTTRDSQGVRF